MRISTFWYCLKQGFANICRNILFSLASIATISACIFLFCLFFALAANVQNAVKTAETTVGITVFFAEDLPDAAIQKAGEVIGSWPEVRQLRFISAEEAWESFKQDYFEGAEELAEGFADDNPLAGSASYEIFLNNIEDQEEVAERLKSMEGVRRVRYASDVAAGFTSAGKMVGALSVVIIGVLLAVAVFLISNTISVTAAFRRRENEIMRYIGAAGYVIRGPFVVEGVILGAAGAAVPLAGMYFLYQKAVVYVNENYQILTVMFQPIAVEAIFPYIAMAAGILGVGIGFFVSFFTINRHLRV